MRRTLGALSVLVCVTGCTATTTAHQPAATAPAPSSTRSTAATPEPTSTAPLPLPQPGGVLLDSVTAIGPEVVVLPHPLSTNVTHLSVRFTCVGPGRTQITSSGGHAMLGTLGCKAGVIYGSSYTRTKKDTRTFYVHVEPGTQWAMEVWSGQPASETATPPSA
jgi:hypothetical protein